MGQKWKPQKIPRASHKPQSNRWTKNLTVKKFPSLKNLQKEVNDVTRKIWLYFICKTMQSGYGYQIVLNTPKNPFLNQATPKKYLPNVPARKNPGIKNYKPKKSFDHPCLLKSREPSLGSYIKLHIHFHHLKSALWNIIYATPRLGQTMIWMVEIDNSKPCV